MGNASAWKPLGIALLEYSRRPTTAEIEFVRSDGFVQREPVASFFNSELRRRDSAALDLCRGRTLDLAAGAGRHALELQRRGLPVVAVDACPEVVEAMRLGGVDDARCAVPGDLRGQSFDTILLLMNGLGIAKELVGLPSLLTTCAELLAPNGVILAESLDVDALPESIHRRYVNAIRQSRYPGDWVYTVKYHEHVGDPVRWLFVDHSTLDESAQRLGLDCEIIEQEERGGFLVAIRDLERSRAR